MGDAMQTVLIMAERAKLMLLRQVAAGDEEAAQLLEDVGVVLGPIRELADAPERSRERVLRVCAVAIAIHERVRDYAERHRIYFTASLTPTPPPPHDTIPCPPPSWASDEDESTPRSRKVGEAIA